MSLKDQMREDFEKVVLNTDEFAETFTVTRNGIVSHEIDGIFASNNRLQVKLSADVIPGDVLKSKDTSRQVTVQSISRTSNYLNVHCH